MTKSARPTSPRSRKSAPPAAKAAGPLVVGVHYQPTIPPLRKHCECECLPQHVLVTGTRLITVKGRSSIAADASLCLSCGTIRELTPKLPFSHWWGAICVFWHEFGWNFAIGKRLQELAHRHTHNHAEACIALSCGIAPDYEPAKPKKSRRRA